MNKHFILLASLLSVGAIAVSAAPLTPEQALRRARGTARVPLRAAALADNTPRLAETVLTRSGNPAVYVFNSPDGSYLMLGADDLAAPVLGYGERAGGEMPPQLRWWLQTQAAEIAWADSVADTASERLRMPAAAAAPTENIGPLLSTFWNQLDPYNLFTPGDNGQHMPTGCVATAMAQVMKYHNYPPRAQGTGYASYGGRQLTRDLDVELKWDQMLDFYYDSDPEASKEAVAELMVTAGYAAHMSYAEGGSGAYDPMATYAMVENFGYDNSAWLYQRDNYTLSQWQQMLVDNLRECGPIYYSGYADAGGHAFVCDGCTDYGYFHFNWGWGGWYDGWFAIDALNPEGIGVGGFEGGFNTSQEAMLGVRLPVEGSVRPQIQLTQMGPVYWTLDDSDITVQCAAYYNMAYPGTFSFDLQVFMTDLADGTEYPVIDYGRNEMGLYQGFGLDTTAPLPDDLPDGEYMIQLYTRENGYDCWVPALHQPVYTAAAHIAVRDGVAELFDPDEAKKELVTIDPLDIGMIVYGDPVYICYYAHNSGDSSILVPVALALVGDDGYIKATTQPRAVEIGAGQDVYQEYRADMTYYDGFSTFTDYRAVLYDTQTYNVYCELGDIRVHEVNWWSLSLHVSYAPSTIEYGESSKLKLNACNYTGRNLTFKVKPILYDEWGEVMAEVTKGRTLRLTSEEEQTKELAFKFDYYSPSIALDTPYKLYLYAIEGDEYRYLDSGDMVAIVGGAGIDDSRCTGLSVTYDHETGRCTATSNSGIETLNARSAEGLRLEVPMTCNGDTSYLDLSGVSGIVIVTATDRTGAVVTRKLAL